MLSLWKKRRQSGVGSLLRSATLAAAGKKILKKTATVVAKKAVDKAKNWALTKAKNAMRKTVTHLGKRKRVTKALKGTKKQKTQFTKVVKEIAREAVRQDSVVGTYRKSYVMDQKVSFDRDNIAYYIVGGRRANDNTAPYTQKALKFTPLSKERILDATSVLFNNKALSIDATLETGNFDPRKLQVKVVYAGAHYKMRNLCNIGLDIEVYEVTNKNTQDSDEFFANMQIEVVNNNIKAGGLADTGAFVDTSTPSDNIWVTNWNLKFGDVKELKDEYSIRVLKKSYVPSGGIFSFAANMKDTSIDFRPYVGPGNLTSDYCKGDVQYLLKVTPRLHAVGKTGLQMGASYQTFDYEDTGLVFQVDELYKIAQPEITEDQYEGEKTVLFNDIPISETEGVQPFDWIPVRTENSAAKFTTVG